MQPFHFEINLLETEKWGVKIQNENQKLVAAKWGGVKMRRCGIMTKIELGPDHNQNTPSGGFELHLMSHMYVDFFSKMGTKCLHF